MSCLLCVKAIYVTITLGMQDVSPNEYDRTNDYSQNIGMVEVVAEAKNGLIGKITHLSGVDSSESDHGINSVSIGAKIYLFKR